MIQVLYALSAMMLASMFVLQQQRNLQHARMVMIYNEVEAQATSVAEERLEEIGAMAFDEQTKGEDGLTSAAQLTGADVFTDDAPPIDDIDDFDGASVARFRVVWQDTLWYQVDTDVAYAEELNPDQEVADPTMRTRFKKVSVTVRTLNTQTDRNDIITLSQSYACGSKCAW